jgi:hypothetical protein
VVIGYELAINPMLRERGIATTPAHRRRINAPTPSFIGRRSWSRRLERGWQIQ